MSSGGGVQLGNRERRLLWVVALLIPILAWQYITPLFSRGGPKQVTDSRFQRESQTLSNRKIVEPRLASLQVSTGAYEPGRNIFRYYVKPPPPPPPPPPAPPPPPPRPTGPAPPPPPPPVPKPPALDVSVLGIFGPERRRIAVIANGEALVNALQNDVIEDKFIVHRIGLESVDFKFVGFPDVEPERVVIGE